MGSFSGIPKSKTGGIYMILNIDNREKVYIGQTRNLHKRAYTHANELRTGRHPNKAMQADFNNGDRMRFVPLETVSGKMSNENRLIREMLYMYAFIGKGYKLYNSESKEHIESMLFWRIVCEQTRKIEKKIHKALQGPLHSIKWRNTERLETLSNPQIE